jgi:hypothetical protein
MITGLAGTIAVAAGRKIQGDPAPPPRALQGRILCFPAPRAYLDALNPGRDRVRIRWHAWNLLEQLTRQVNVARNIAPAWERTGAVPGGPWKTKCELNLNWTCPQLAGKFSSGVGLQSPVSSPQLPPPTSAPSGLPRFSTVFYSGATAQWIQTNGLAKAGALDSLLRTSNAVPAAHPEAIVVKEIWEGVSLAPNSDFAVSVFDPNLTPRIPGNASLAALINWPKLVLLHQGVNLDETTPCGTDYDVQPPESVTPTLPVRCFFYKKSKARCDTLVALVSGPQVQNSSTLPTSLPCVVVLVGVQIATREQDDWTWSTYWWTNHSASACLDGTGTCTEGRPSDLPEAFGHFAMDTMLSGPSQQDGHIVFNPYLEGPNRNGTTTTCLKCHANARYEYDAAAATADTGRHGREVTGVYLSRQDPACGLTDTNRLVSGCPLTTSLLWSLVTNQDRNSIVASIFILPLRSHSPTPPLLSSPPKRVTPK